MKRVYLVLLVALCLVGCTAQHSKQTLQQLGQTVHLLEASTAARGQSWVLPASTRVYLAYSEPLITTGHEVVSFNRLQRALVAEMGLLLKPLYANIIVAETPASPLQASLSARQAGCDVVMYLDVLALADNLSSYHEIDQDYGVMTAWAEQRASTSTGVGLDNLIVGVRVLDARSGYFLDYLKVRSDSGAAQVHRNAPIDLVDGTARALVGMLADR